MKLSRNKLLVLLYVCIIFIGVCKSYYDENIAVAVMPVDKKCIVIDAGHGGFDPGKVASGTDEKNINLSIANKLYGFLEQGGAIVKTTRINDDALSNNKREDLKKRAETANTSKADLFVSIHQNSFPKGDVKGAQVFYYKESEKGKELANKIQKRLKEVVDIENDRVSKANESYYVLKQIEIPSVIVECGFLSNHIEREKLLSDEYQEKIAWAIYMGILDYFGESVA